jgi:hypothetical protein
MRSPDRVMTENADGQWVPAVPEPFHGAYWRGCPADGCDAEFFTRRGYRGHYALEHTGMNDGRPGREPWLFARRCGQYPGRDADRRCRRWFLTWPGYAGHYILEHVLRLGEGS